MQPSSDSTEFPLRMGNAAELPLLQAFLRRCDFTEGPVCRALGLSSLGELGRIDWQKMTLAELHPGSRFCIEVFIKGGQVDLSLAREICGDADFDVLMRVGLLRFVHGNTSKVVCPVWLYPVGEFWVASDRTTDPDGGRFDPGEDVVFPAIYPGTLRFLKLLPEVEGADALDLCGGSGIGALRLSRTCRSCVTTDLTRRAAAFAEFNGWLNGAAIASLCGDLYEPVGERQFDIVTAHPPFVPAVGSSMVYRDGGADGEAITRRVVEGMPQYLRPGGAGVVLCVARDENSRKFEERAAVWLGPAADEFDVVFGLEKILSVEEVVASLKRGQRSLDESSARELGDRLRSGDTRQFIYGALYLRRHGSQRRRPPGRQNLTDEGTAADFGRWLDWREFARAEGIDAWLAAARPHPVAHLQLVIRHAVVEGELAPVECVFSQTAGFQSALRPDGWVVPILARLNGTVTVQQVFDSARNADELPKGFQLSDFLGLLKKTVEMGLMQFDHSRPN